MVNKLLGWYPVCEIDNEDGAQRHHELVEHLDPVLKPTLRRTKIPLINQHKQVQELHYQKLES